VRKFASARGGRSRFTPVRIPTSDGLELSGEIVECVDGQSAGTIIFVHGFCGNKRENGLFHALAADCSDMGFRSVLYDWRGLSESDGDFPSTNLDDHTEDFQQVAEWTQSNLLGGSAPLLAVGFSLGAAIVGLALRRQLRLSSVAYLSPAVRPRLSMWPRYNDRRILRELEERGVVEKPDSSVLLGRPILESLRDTDLGPDAFDVPPPLLVCHGTEDTRIDCAHTRNLVAHRAQGRGFRYVEFEGASHSFRPETSCWPRLGSAITSWFAEAPPSHKGDRAKPTSSLT
jgi:pimeloyl-ACP methyl ester carboxylesterase